MQTTSDQSGAPTNRLIGETSPYLLQHAHNPVDWRPWGEEALSLARDEDKPILLSVGYSACHWCHVMAHESFEDPATADVMNRFFINIKVDREERPDIDALYMEAVQGMTGRGGWPMTVFLTPGGEPFYAGTYFPPTARHGLPGFTQLLHAIARAWQERRDEMIGVGRHVVSALQRNDEQGAPSSTVDGDLLASAARTLVRQHDAELGGLTGAPKFPQPMLLDFLLQSHLRSVRAGGSPEPAHLAIARLTLDKMAAGGIYDQLGGGFHRYSTDERWLIPHFEKMLYDNAQLARTYLHAWQITGDAEYRRITEETLDYVLREMTSPEGGFYSSQDADSEGAEGKYSVWSLDQVVSVLGPDLGALAARYFGVTERGNFPEGGPGACVLHRPGGLEEFSASEGLTENDLKALLTSARGQLLAARERRVAPGRDDKILAEWNGLMIRALAEAGAALGRPDYLTAACRAGDFLLSHMAHEDAAGFLRLARSYRDGAAKLNAYLEDYGASGLAFLTLYQTTGERRWLSAAERCAASLVKYFLDGARGGFFRTSSDHERLVARKRDWFDNAIPSGNSLAAELLLRLGRLLDKVHYIELVRRLLQQVGETMMSQPAAFGSLLCVLDVLTAPLLEVAVVGDPAEEGSRELLQVIHARFMPELVLAMGRPEGKSEELLPLLRGRSVVDGKATAYVCLDATCQLPVTNPDALVAQLPRHAEAG